jgi:hypothetical protein
LIINAFTYHGPTRDEGLFPTGKRTGVPVCVMFFEPDVLSGGFPVQPAARMNPAITRVIIIPENLMPFIQYLSELFFPTEMLL